MLEVLLLHVGLVDEVLEICDGQHHHADAREDVAVNIGQGCLLPPFHAQDMVPEVGFEPTREHAPSGV